MEILKQPKSSPVPVEKQVAILYAVIHDFLRDVPVEEVSAYEKGLYPYLDERYPDWLRDIRETGVMTGEAEQTLRTALDTYTAQFLA